MGGEREEGGGRGRYSKTKEQAWTGAKASSESGRWQPDSSNGAPPSLDNQALRACELTEKGERGLLSALLSDLLKAGGPLPTPLEGGVEHGTLGCSTHLPKGLCPAPRPASAPKSYAQSKPLLHHLFNGSPNSPRTSLIYNTVDT